MIGEDPNVLPDLRIQVATAVTEQYEKASDRRAVIMEGTKLAFYLGHASAKVMRGHAVFFRRVDDHVDQHVCPIPKDG